MPTVARIIQQRRRRKARKDAAAKRSAMWLALISGVPALLVSLPIVAALGLALWLYVQAASAFPDFDRLMAGGEAARFYARDDTTLLYSAAGSGDGETPWLGLDALGETLPAALIALEEPAFYANAGFDPLAALLNIWRYMLGWQPETDTGIAGNLTRDELLPRAFDSALDASLLERVLAAESERRLSADQLLEWRLNTMYFGADAFGAEAAARLYFGKSAAALDLAEAAMLLSLAAEPQLDVTRDAPQLRQRQAALLDAMLAAGVIGADEYDRASRATPQIKDPDARYPDGARDFIQYARRQAARILDALGQDGDRALALGGLRVTTTLDALLPDLPDDVSLVILAAGSGEILSMSGAALDHEKQPGGILQPFVYMEGFLRRIVTPASMVYDLPQVYPGAADGLIYTPANRDGRYRGPLNLRDAMAAGLLPPAAQIAESVSMAQVLRTARRLGFSHLDTSRASLDLLERGGGASALDAAYAYSVMANMGVMAGLPAHEERPGARPRDPVAVLRIHDSDGNLLWRYNSGASNATALIEPSLAYMVNHVLSDAAARNRTLEIASPAPSRPTAFVDGISADDRDRWTVAYTPHLTLAAHRRHAGAEPTDLADSSAAWLEQLDEWHRRLGLAAETWRQPSDIEEFVVCELSGLLPLAENHCPTRLEILPAGSPLSSDIYWQSVELNSLTNQLATVSTPENLRRSQTYFVPPDEIMDWWIANGKPLPPSEYAAAAPAPTRPLQLVQPDNFAYVAGAVEISGRVNRAGAVDLLLEYGLGANPSRWIEIAREEARQAPLELSAAWDASTLDGIITVRLSAAFADGAVVADTRQFTLDNAKPVVSLRMSDGGETISFPSQGAISLLAEARDNLAIDRVEFYRDGDLLGIDRDWPYGMEFTVEGAGTLDFRAVAVDQVGNRGESALSIAVELEAR